MTRCLVQGEVCRVTLSVASIDSAIGIYRDLLGMKEMGHGQIRESDEDWPAFAAVYRASAVREAEWVDLAQPGTRVGAMRLVRFGDGSGETVTEGARHFDHGLVKNLDFFTDDVHAGYAAFVAAGYEFLSPPVDYKVPWGDGAIATEAHSAAFDGVKLSLARMAGVPRIAMGRSNRETRFTEVAAAAQVVSDFDRAEAFYCEALDLIPAAPTVVEGSIVAALKLPAGTRLRMSFLSGAEGAGGRVGLIAYEGPGVSIARDLSDRLRAPYRGVMSLAFACTDVERATARAIALGARLVVPPEPRPWDGLALAATVLSPDGIPLEFHIAADATPRAAFQDVCAVDELLAGGIREFRPREGSRTAVANVAGQLFAFEDRCPHLGGPLSRGEMRGRRLVCPWHGWTIDVPTGLVDGGRGLSVRSCPIRVSNGRVEVHPIFTSGEKAGL